MTLGRCSTNGASGTFIDEQCGSSASATDRTAYSCSSRSLRERARVAARARSRSSSPVRRMVPASTREVTRPRSRRTSISGRRAEQPVDVEGPAHRVGRRPAGAAASGRRSARRRWRPGRARARPSRARRRRSGRTASATTAIQCSPSSAPSAKTHALGARRRVGGVVRTRRRRRAPRSPTRVSQVRPARRPTTTCGTVRTESPGSSAKREGAEADQAGAGLVDARRGRRRGRWSRSTTCRRRRSGSGPAVRISAATPQPTRPSSRRSQVTGVRRPAAGRAAGRPTSRSSRSCGPTGVLGAQPGSSLAVTSGREPTRRPRCRPDRHARAVGDGQDQ